jgi:hypothetical protein
MSDEIQNPPPPQSTMNYQLNPTSPQEVDFEPQIAERDLPLGDLFQRHLVTIDHVKLSSPYDSLKMSPLISQLVMQVADSETLECSGIERVFEPMKANYICNCLRCSPKRTVQDLLRVYPRNLSGLTVVVIYLDSPSNLEEFSCGDVIVLAPSQDYNVPIEAFRKPGVFFCLPPNGMPYRFRPLELSDLLPLPTACARSLIASIVSSSRFLWSPETRDSAFSITNIVSIVGVSAAIGASYYLFSKRTQALSYVADAAVEALLKAVDARVESFMQGLGLKTEATAVRRLMVFIVSSFVAVFGIPEEAKASVLMSLILFSGNATIGISQFSVFIRSSVIAYIFAMWYCVRCIIEADQPQKGFREEAGGPRRPQTVANIIDTVTTVTGDPTVSAFASNLKSSKHVSGFVSDISSPSFLQSLLGVSKVAAAVLVLHKFVATATAAFQDWQDTVEKNQHMECVDRVRVILSNPHKSSGDLVILHREIPRLRVLARLTEKSEAIQIHDVIGKAESAHNRLRNALLTRVIPETPFNIWLYGSGGIGKTTLRPFMLSMLSQIILKKPLDEADVYNYHMSAKYHDDYNGAQLFCMDDTGSALLIEDGSLGVHKLLLEGTPFALNAAELSNKDNLIVDLRGSVSISNNPVPPGLAQLDPADQAAVLRRYNLMLEVTSVQGEQKSHMMSHLRFTLKMASGEPVMGVQPMTFPDFLHFLERSMRAHKAAFSTRATSIIAKAAEIPMADNVADALLARLAQVKPEMGMAQSRAALAVVPTPRLPSFMKVQMTSRYSPGPVLLQWSVFKPYFTQHLPDQVYPIPPVLDDQRMSPDAVLYFCKHFNKSPGSDPLLNVLTNLVPIDFFVRSSILIETPVRDYLPVVKCALGLCVALGGVFAMYKTISWATGDQDSVEEESVPGRPVSRIRYVRPKGRFKPETNSTYQQHHNVAMIQNALVELSLNNSGQEWFAVGIPVGTREVLTVKHFVKLLQAGTSGSLNLVYKQTSLVFPLGPNSEVTFRHGDGDTAIIIFPPNNPVSFRSLAPRLKTDFIPEHAADRPCSLVHPHHIIDTMYTEMTSSVNVLPSKVNPARIISEGVKYYTNRNTNGWCGAPLVDASGDIVALHVAGSGGLNGIGQLLCAMQVTDYADNPVVTTEPYTFPDPLEVLKDYRPYTMIDAPYPIITPRLVRNDDLAGVLGPQNMVRKIPPAYNWVQEVSEDGFKSAYHPVIENLIDLLDYNNRVLPQPDLTFDKAFSVQLGARLAKMRTRSPLPPPRFLSTTEVLNQPKAVMHLNHATSSGSTSLGVRPKHGFISKNPDGLFVLDPRLQEQVNKGVEALHAGIPLEDVLDMRDLVYRCVPKQELRTPGKLARLIYGSPLVFLLLEMMFYGSIVSVCKLDPYACMLGVGIRPIAGFRVMYKRLSKFLKVLGMDMFRYDQTFKSWSRDMYRLLVLSFLSESGIDMDSPHYRGAQNLLYANQFLSFGPLVFLVESVLSGRFLTTITDGAALLAHIAGAIHQYFIEVENKTMTPEEVLGFMVDRGFMSFGDDMTGAYVNADMARYIVKHLRECGFYPTSSLNKQLPPGPQNLLNEAEFLSRRFTMIDGEIYPQLKPDSLFNILEYRWADMSQAEFLRLVSKMIWMELIMWPDVFEQEMCKLRTLHVNLGIDIPDYLWYDHATSLPMLNDADLLEPWTDYSDVIPPQVDEFEEVVETSIVPQFDTPGDLTGCVFVAEVGTNHVSDSMVAFVLCWLWVKICWYFFDMFVVSRLDFRIRPNGFVQFFKFSYAALAQPDPVTFARPIEFMPHRLGGDPRQPILKSYKPEMMAALAPMLMQSMTEAGAGFAAPLPYARPQRPISAGLKKIPLVGNALSGVSSFFGLQKPSQQVSDSIVHNSNTPGLTDAPTNATSLGLGVQGLVARADSDDIATVKNAGSYYTPVLHVSVPFAASQGDYVVNALPLSPGTTWCDLSAGANYMCPQRATASVGLHCSHYSADAIRVRVTAYAPGLMSGKFVLAFGGAGPIRTTSNFTTGTTSASATGSYILDISTANQWEFSMAKPTPYPVQPLLLTRAGNNFVDPASAAMTPTLFGSCTLQVHTPLRTVSGSGSPVHLRIDVAWDNLRFYGRSRLLSTSVVFLPEVKETTIPPDDTVVPMDEPPTSETIQQIPTPFPLHVRAIPLVGSEDFKSAIVCKAVQNSTPGIVATMTFPKDLLALGAYQNKAQLAMFLEGDIELTCHVSSAASTGGHLGMYAIPCGPMYGTNITAMASNIARLSYFPHAEIIIGSRPVFTLVLKRDGLIDAYRATGGVAADLIEERRQVSWTVFLYSSTGALNCASLTPLVDIVVYARLINSAVKVPFPDTYVPEVKETGVVTKDTTMGETTQLPAEYDLEKPIPPMQVPGLVMEDRTREGEYVGMGEVTSALQLFHAGTIYPVSGDSTLASPFTPSTTTTTFRQTSLTAPWLIIEPNSSVTAQDMAALLSSYTAVSGATEFALTPWARPSIRLVSNGNPQGNTFLNGLARLLPRTQYTSSWSPVALNSISATPNIITPGGSDQYRHAMTYSIATNYLPPRVRIPYSHHAKATFVPPISSPTASHPRVMPGVEYLETSTNNFTAASTVYTNGGNWSLQYQMGDDWRVYQQRPITGLTISDGEFTSMITDYTTGYYTNPT